MNKEPHPSPKTFLIEKEMVEVIIAIRLSNHIFEKYLVGTGYLPHCWKSNK